MGTYNTISLFTTLAKIPGLFGGGYRIEISDPGDGTLLFAMPSEEIEWRFVEVEPLYFRQVDGPFGIVFHEDENGRITRLSTDLMPEYDVLKLDWYETPGFNMVLLQGCTLAFLFMILAAVIRAIQKRLRSDPKPASRGARAAYWTILGISVLNLLVLAGIFLGQAEIMQNVLLDPPLIVKIALGFGVLSAGLTAGALVYTVLAWKNNYWGAAFRAYYTLVTVAAVAYVWFMNYWNLLGWRY